MTPAEIDQARTSNHGNVVEPRRVPSSRDPGSLSWTEAAGLHDGTDDRLSARGQEGVWSKSWTSTAFKSPPRI